jgi:hypothetical protein
MFLWGVLVFQLNCVTKKRFIPIRLSFNGYVSYFAHNFPMSRAFWGLARCLVQLNSK